MIYGMNAMELLFQLKFQRVSCCSGRCICSHIKPLRHRICVALRHRHRERLPETVAHLLDFKLLDLMPDSAVFADSSMLGAKNDESRKPRVKARTPSEVYPSYATEMKTLRFNLWLQMVDKMHGTPADVMAPRPPS